MRHFVAVTIAMAVAALSTTPSAVDAQRCTTTPTYSTRRVSVGAYESSYRRGGATGILARIVFGNTSIEVRREEIDAHWYEPHGYFVGGYDEDVLGRSAGTTLRRSIPLGDGLAALCLVLDVTSTALDATNSDDFYAFGLRHHEEMGVGAGLAVPIRMSDRVNLSAYFELRRVSHHAVIDPGEYQWKSRAVGAEFLGGVGFALPLNITLAVQAAAPFYDTRSEGVPKWKEHGVAKLRAMLQYNFDLR